MDQVEALTDVLLAWFVREEGITDLNDTDREHATQLAASLYHKLQVAGWTLVRAS